MAIFLTFMLAFVLGYVYGFHIKPKRRLRQALKDVRSQCVAALEEGNTGIYKTIVTERDKSSELTVEVKELAITQNGLVKVQYISAFYKNPEFRTKKGDALLNEVRDMLGDFLPLNEVEWYENTEKHERIKKYLNSLTVTQYNLL
ncbi:hypothetical protein [Pontibacter harenae]|uniref:hypothetical protein n=1 Tax=Pontibacter harenae TaxID=2894083 RepID=UPI001E361396|nr:hypothetical protein [Pontibacter harenae]MCC9166983.1 hypothetical protein [Pontibacter harenae]